MASFKLLLFANNKLLIFANLAQRLKRLPAMRETWVRSLANILAWRIPWREEPGGEQSMGLQRVRHD